MQNGRRQIFSSYPCQYVGIYQSRTHRILRFRELPLLTKTENNDAKGKRVCYKVFVGTNLEITKERFCFLTFTVNH